MSTMFSHNMEFFSYREHLGVILNTDGVSLFKSSQSTVYLEIANFPPMIRFRHDNVIICGVWVGQSKPDMNILLKPILEDIDKMNTLGFSFCSPEGMKTIRVKLLFGVFDLVAKAKVLNMKQFNGICGCPACIHPGEHRGSRVYLPGSSYPLRTVAGIDRAIAEGSRRGTVIEGIKGISPLRNYLNLVDGVPPDYMHCVLEGVTKSLLIAWTSPKYRDKPFSIRRYLSQVDKALFTPQEFSRSPRSIVRDLSYWKASEFRTWLLFFSLPLLVKFLPPLYFHHFSLLVNAMHLLLSKEVTLIQCNVAEEMLGDFYNLLPELYGVHSCTLNAHSLTHLPHFVRLWGPLWVQSAFSFESHNGNLKRMVHSTRKVAEQLLFCIDVRLTLQHLYHKMDCVESEELITFLQYSNHTHRGMTKLRHGYAVGTIKTSVLSDHEFRELKKLCSSVAKEVKTFERLFFKNIRLHTIHYHDGDRKRNNAYCCYSNHVGIEAFGELQKFAECPPLGTIAFIKPMKKTQSNILQTMQRST